MVKYRIIEHRSTAPGTLGCVICNVECAHHYYILESIEEWNEIIYTCVKCVYQHNISYNFYLEVDVSYGIRILYDMQSANRYRPDLFQQGMWILTKI